MACNDGDVRLFGGYTKNDGIAEVCIGGQWADICYSGVTSRTTLAMVFCRQLIGREPRMSITIHDLCYNYIIGIVRERRAFKPRGKAEWFKLRLPQLCNSNKPR